MLMQCCPHCGASRPATREKIPGLEYSLEDCVVRFRGRAARLTRQELDVFRFLADVHPREVSLQTIYDHLYQLKPEADWPEPKIVCVIISKLRRALAEAGIGITVPRMSGLGTRKGSYSLEVRA